VKITNIYNLPQQLVDLVDRDYKYTENEYRVTSLLKGVRENLLLRRHHEEIVVDVADMIWLLFGTAVHAMLEAKNEADCEIKEERMRIPVGQYILSGQFDLYNGDTKTITDYKTASIWKIVHGDFSDWRQQELVYAHMLKEIGFPVENGEIIAFLKDHSKSKAKFDVGYPQKPVAKVEFSFDKTDYVEIAAWIEERFAEICRAEILPDDKLPMCTDKERWYTGTTYAVMKKGRKSALRVLDSYEAAEKWMEKNEKGETIVERPGEDKKCVDYCMANTFCEYWREVYGQ
jgi:hypothetical protein